MCMRTGRALIHIRRNGTGIVIHTWDPSNWEAKAGGLKIPHKLHCSKTVSENKPHMEANAYILVHIDRRMTCLKSAWSTYVSGVEGGLKRTQHDRKCA